MEKCVIFFTKTFTSFTKKTNEHLLSKVLTTSFLFQIDKTPIEKKMGSTFVFKIFQVELVAFTYCTP